MSGRYRGFVLQATYRIQQGLPVVHLFGRLEDGRTFVIRDYRQVPSFYVDRSDREQVRSARTQQTDIVGFDGAPLTKVEVKVPGDAPGVRDGLQDRGFRTYEADVRYAMRYLIDRDIRGGIEIEGEARSGNGTTLEFIDPETRPADVFIQPRLLSFDIETTADAEQLLAIAMYGEGVDEVVVVDPRARKMPEHAVGVADEAQAIKHFCEVVSRLDVDVLTGWNVIDFDLTVLKKIADRLKIDFSLGREAGAMRIRQAEGYFGSGSANIPGRLVLDGMDLIRGAFIRMDDFSLDGVARSVLGEGKTLGGEGRDKVAEIMDTYHHDLDAFAMYARTDARLVVDILDELDVVDLAFARSRLTGMPPDRVAASIASFDFLYLSALHKQGIAAPTVRSSGRASVAQGGGAVFEPTVGIHGNVWVCDFKSLYPSIIRTFNIDPLGYQHALGREDVIKTYDGTAFSRERGILPDMLDALFPQRAEAKHRGDNVASQAIKILMNSFYGVLGTPACRFYNPVIANAITSQGRYLLGWSRDWFQEAGFKVLYGDTDSVFVASGMDDAAEAERIAEGLVEEFNAALTDHIMETAGVDSRLELEFEKMYEKLFLARVRGGSQGARKRYAGVRYGSEEVEFVGMEVVRRDWTDLAKEVQRNLFDRLFKGEEVASYLDQTVARLRAGELDDQLVYRKGLRKAVSSYTTNVPPHVQAVKKSSAPPPRIVSYIVTQQGPELADELKHPIDIEHYVDRQVRPVAEPVLEALGLKFSQVIGDDRQIDLFG